MHAAPGQVYAVGAQVFRVGRGQRIPIDQPGIGVAGNDAAQHAVVAVYPAARRMHVHHHHQTAVGQLLQDVVQARLIQVTVGAQVHEDHIGQPVLGAQLPEQAEPVAALPPFFGLHHDGRQVAGEVALRAQQHRVAHGGEHQLFAGQRGGQGLGYLRAEQHVRQEGGLFTQFGQPRCGWRLCCASGHLRLRGQVCQVKLHHQGTAQGTGHGQTRPTPALPGAHGVGPHRLLHPAV